MNKKYWVTLIMTLGLVLALAGVGSAAGVPNLANTTWSGTINFANYEPGTGYDHNSADDQSMEVTDQFGNIFQGTIFGTWGLTGNIATNKVITATATDGQNVLILTGKLTGKKITGTYNQFQGATFVATGNFSFTKQ